MEKTGLRFQGKVAIVTGGASGIGAAVARRLAEEGAAVVVADIAPGGGEFAERLRAAGARAEFVHTDIGRADRTDAMVAAAVDVFGGLDLLAHCAGIFPRATLEETTEPVWNRIMDTNLKGSYHVCRSAVPALIARGAGSIVAVGSMNAYGGADNLFAYSVSKGGLWTMVRNLAKALAKHRIRVNCVTPGWVSSEGELELHRRMGAPQDWLSAEGSKLPFGRLQSPDDIAAAILFLLSDEAGQITGQDLAVDGGMGLG